MRSVFTLTSKLGGLAVGAFGLNTHNLMQMSIGSAVAVVVHFIDSVWNSPKGEKPNVIEAVSSAFAALKG